MYGSKPAPMKNAAKPAGKPSKAAASAKKPASGKSAKAGKRGC
jgi:hypothetical protein